MTTEPSTHGPDGPIIGYVDRRSLNDMRAGRIYATHLHSQPLAGSPSDYSLAVILATPADDSEPAKGAGGGLVPMGVKCTGCGSAWDDERLLAEKEKRPHLRSCCPERKMVPVYALAPSPVAAGEAVSRRHQRWLCDHSISRKQGLENCATCGSKIEPPAPADPDATYPPAGDLTAQTQAYMAEPVAGLVERLKAWAESSTSSYLVDVLDEAAERITALEANVERLQLIAINENNLLREAQADRDRLREVFGWLATNVALSLNWGADDEEEPHCWRVFEEFGGRSDRDWRLVGSGVTPLEALERAYATRTEPEKAEAAQEMGVGDA